MKFDSGLFVHPLDKAALKALQAIPGFTPVLKAMVKVLSERQFQVANMATNLRISEKQLPEYYNMLPPICERLGIEVPELYLQLDGTPNAYTSGDTKPFIVMTSGLVEKFPPQLIPAVLAHECGHIACRHVLYHTMGSVILSGAAGALDAAWGIGDLVTMPLQTAFARWMRCSELSADRAAALVCGENAVVHYCMRFAGYPANAPAQPNVEAFLAQAEDYNTMLEGSVWNKVLELMMYSNASHPVNAARAQECMQWSKTEEYQNIMRYADAQLPLPEDVLCPLPAAAKKYCHKDSTEVKAELEAVGFNNVQLRRYTEETRHFKQGETVVLTVNDTADAEKGTWYVPNTPVVIDYYEPWTEEEIAAMHPGQARTPGRAGDFLGCNYESSVEVLQQAGFTNFDLQQQRDVTKGWFTKDREVLRIAIDGVDNFEKGVWFSTDAKVEILYRVHPIKL